MTKEQFNLEMENLFNEYEEKLLKNYDTAALLLNSFDITKKHYQGRESNFVLSTINNLPPIYKHPIADIAPTHYLREDLLNIYEKQLIVDVTNYYLINTVSTLDLLIESLHKSYSANIKNKPMKGRWNYSPTCFDDFNLIKPTNYKSTLSNAFSAYGVFRTLRHSLVHNDRKMLADNIKKIKNFENGTLSKDSFLNSNYIENNKIILTHDFLYNLRYWAYTFFYYLCDSFRLTFPSF